MAQQRALAEDVRLRPARAEDAWAVRRLIWRVRIYPFGLDWRRFWLAVDRDNRLLACGQVKRLPDGSRELASIASQPRARGQGIASALVRRLITLNDPPLFLICAAALVPFYRRFGFVEIPLDDMPPDLARRWRAAENVRRAVKSLHGVVVMRLDRQDEG